MQNRLILASASPQRRELLAQICPDFDVFVSPYAEPQYRGGRVSATQWAEALAYFKARAVADRHPDRWVLGADTLVTCNARMLGKPRDLPDARDMLELQARHVSEVITGVCLMRRGVDNARLAASAVTRVWMRNDPELREAYLTSGDWRDKAVLYGIQTVGDRLVQRLEGSFSNVVGLPLELVQDLLQTIETAPAPAPLATGFGPCETADG